MKSWNFGLRGSLSGLLTFTIAISLNLALPAIAEVPVPVPPAPPWILDPSFHLNTLPEHRVPVGPWGYAINPVKSVAIQSDGKILLGGIITSDNGTYRSIVRLLSNGEVDPAFRPGTRILQTQKIAIDAQGHIYAYSSLDGTDHSLLKLDSTGEILWSRTLHVPRVSHLTPSLLVRPDGSVVVGGSFTTSATNQSFLALFNADGDLQSQFNPQLDGAIGAMALQPDGKLVISGFFTSVNGVPRQRLARLTSTGELDPTLDPGSVLTTETTALAIQPDGKIVVSGPFNVMNLAPRDRLLRLNSDGSLDQSFSVRLDEPAHQISIDSQDRIILAGSFNSVNDLPRRRLARLHHDGTLDPSFDSSLGPTGPVDALAIDANGAFVIGGRFSSIGHRAARGVARVLPHSSTATVDFSKETFVAVELYREAVIQLLRFGPSTNELIVDLWTAPGNEPHLSEFLPYSAQVRLAPGELAKTVLIPFPDDGLVELSERIALRCKVRGEAEAKTSFIEILDDEVPVIFTEKIPTPGFLYSQQTPPARSDVAHNRIAFSGMISSEAGVPDPQFYGVGAINLDGTPLNFSPVRVEPAEFGSVRALAWTPDNRLLIGGWFSSLNGVSRNNLARVNLDGSIDPTFTLPFPSGVAFLAVRPDGKALVAAEGPLSSASGGPALIRVNVDGTVDPSFQPELPSGRIIQMSLLADGKVLIHLWRTGLFRLLPDGKLDASFTSAFFRSPYIGFVPLQNGKILVHGSFQEIDGVHHRGLARLNSDGSVDLTFRPEVGIALDLYFHSEIPVPSVFVRDDGKLLVKTSQYGNHILLNEDGSISRDLVFSSYTSPLIEIMAALPGGRMLTSSLSVIPSANRELESVVFETPQLIFPEGPDLHSFRITRIGDVSKPATIVLDFELLKGDLSDDYSIAPTYSTLGAGDREARHLLRLNADGRIEEDEIYRITAPADGRTTFVPASADLVIQDQDGRPGSARFLPSLTNLFSTSVLPLDNGLLLLAGVTDLPFVLFNPVTGEKTSVTADLAEDRRPVSALATVSGGFVVGGPFLGESHQPLGAVYRFHANGTQDTTFLSPPLGLFPRWIFPELAGTLLAVGEPLWNGSSNFYQVARLNANGSLKETFRLEAPPNSAILLPNDKLLYSAISGVYSLDLSTGTSTLVLPPATADVRKMLRAGDHFYAAGFFHNVNGVSGPSILRFSLDGTLDPSFRVQLNELAHNLALDSNGRLLIFGYFTKVNDRVLRNRVARLNHDGSIDLSFNPDLSLFAAGTYGSINSVTPLPTGELFAIVQFLNTSLPVQAAIISSDLPHHFSLSVTAPGELQLHLTTIPQTTYIIERSTNLSHWNLVIQTNVTSYTLSLPISTTSPQNFFRARILP